MKRKIKKGTPHSGVFRREGMQRTLRNGLRKEFQRGYRQQEQDAF